jgi:hypothetical protein
LRGWRHDGDGAGAVLVATALTLLFLPALYAALFRVRRPDQQRTADSAPPLPTPADSIRPTLA